MKVLITAWYDSANTYVKDLVDFLMDHCEVVCSREAFWHTNLHFDVIHIQWPEHLFFGKKINEIEVKNLERRIAYLKRQGTRIVSTLHNYVPHQKSTFDKQIYEIVYGNSDAIVNLEEYSMSLYPASNNVVIPHPNYNRHIEILQLSEGDKFLCFGNIRTVEEERQIIEGFIRAGVKDSELIILNSLAAYNPYRWRTSLFKRIRYLFFLNRIQKKNIRLVRGKVSQQDVNKYFNWATYIISPRINNLNSGVVYLGYSFGKLVIGPKIGNIEKVLESLDNPTFEPLNIDSIANAIKRAVCSSKSTGPNNKAFSDRNFDPKVIAEAHFQLYQSIACNVSH